MSTSTTIAKTRKASADDTSALDPVPAAEVARVQAQEAQALALATLARAQEEWAVAVAAARATREQYYEIEGQRLRAHGDPDAQTAAVRAAMTSAHLHEKALEGVIETLQMDVQACTTAVVQAEQHAGRDAARREWNARVPLQRAAMARLEAAIGEVGAALEEVGRLAAEQSRLGQVLHLGARADAALFRRRSLRYWLELEIGKIIPEARPHPDISAAFHGKSLASLNPFAQEIHGQECPPVDDNP